jgi:hypothetical protein
MIFNKNQLFVNAPRRNLAMHDSGMMECVLRMPVQLFVGFWGDVCQCLRQRISTCIWDLSTRPEYVCMDACMYMYVYMYLCMYVYIYIYIYIYCVGSWLQENVHACVCFFFSARTFTKDQ